MSASEDTLLWTKQTASWLQVWRWSAMQAVQTDPEGWPAHQPIHCAHVGRRGHAQPPAQGQLLLLQLLHGSLCSPELPQLPQAEQLRAAEGG